MLKIFFILMYFMLISYRPVVNNCLQAQFLYNGNCCDMCPAGTELVDYCGASSPTRCRTCSSGTFTNHIHNLKACYPCLDCGGGFVEILKCRPNKNSVCRCNKGYYCSKKGFDTCWNCRSYTPCPLGEGVKVQGTETTDIKCEVCPPGSYSDESTTTGKCKPITVCHALGMVATIDATKSKNTKCIYPEAIVLPLVVLSIICVAAVIFCNKQWLRCGRIDRSDTTDNAQDDIEKREKSLENKKGTQPTNDGQMLTVTKSSSAVEKDVKTESVSTSADDMHESETSDTVKVDSVQIIHE
ncbi:tumor necrosis factor receptor superfamily member 5-like [Mustelus asterias]